MLSLEQAIEHAEEVAIEQAYLMGRYDAASGYARSGNEAIRTNSAKECEKCAEGYRQLAAWLRELQERRKEPEIVHCGECRWYGRADKRRFYRGMDCLQRRMSTIVPDKDFCSKAERAERRTDD